MNIINYVYPKSEFVNGVYIPFNIEEEKIEKIKLNLEQITKLQPDFILQTEYFYRDTVFITENKKEFYCKKQTTSHYNKKSKNLHIVYTTEFIEAHNFPILNCYHHVENKEIYKYGNVLLIKNNNNWTICVEYKSKESIEKVLEQILKII